MSEEEAIGMVMKECTDRYELSYVPYEGKFAKALLNGYPHTYMILAKDDMRHLIAEFFRVNFEDDNCKFDPEAFAKLADYYNGLEGNYTTLEDELDLSYPECFADMSHSVVYKSTMRTAVLLFVNYARIFEVYPSLNKMRGKEYPDLMILSGSTVEQLIEFETSTLLI